MKYHRLECLPGTKTDIRNSKIYNDNIHGSNCYSYAFHHPEINGTRPHKSVPGIIAEKLYGTIFPENNWQKCSKDTTNRVLKDGESIAKYLNLGIKNIHHLMKGTLKKKLRKAPRPMYNKVVMVLAHSNNPKETTDFHFYAQSNMNTADIYNVPLVCYYNKSYVKTNEYIKAGVHPYVTNMKLKRMALMGNNQCDKIVNSLDKNNRCKLNIKIHQETMPKYMIDFMPNVSWILDIDNHQILNGTWKNIIQHRIKLIDELPEEQKNILLIALKKFLKGERRFDRPVCTWKHKLGWATKVLNTDGNGKLIFNVEKALKKHGGYDYKTVCGVFETLTGYGATSPWGINKLKKKE